MKKKEWEAQRLRYDNLINTVSSQVRALRDTVNQITAVARVFAAAAEPARSRRRGKRSRGTKR